MPVVTVSSDDSGEPGFLLVDGRGDEMSEVCAFLRTLAVRRFSPNTIRAYAYDLQKLLSFLNDRGLGVDEFTPARAAEFLTSLRVTTSVRRAQRTGLSATGGAGRLLSPRTCNRILGAVSSFYEFLITTDAYAGPENPVLKRPDSAAARASERWRPPLVTSTTQRPVRRSLRVRTTEPLPRSISEEAYQALVAVLRNRRDRALVELMCEGGLRPGEVLGLHLEDIAYGRRRVTVRWREDHPRGVRQKSRRDRVVDLLEGRALAAVNDYVLQERPTDADAGLVFLVGGSGRRPCEPLSYGALVRMFARAAERAGVREPWLTPHSLRHTHATRMSEAGMRELTLMKRLGHASPDSTKVYTRLSDPEVLADYQRAIADNR